VLLDVGCGDGGVARLLRARVAEVVAVDVEPSAAWADAPGLAFRVANGEELPFGEASFDVVHAKDALHHMERPDRALAELSRVLRPGGAALIVEANRASPSFFVQMTLVRRHQHFTRRRFENLVRGAFPLASLGSFEAHFVPGAGRLLGVQGRIEDALERLRPFRPLLSYNFAVARG